VKDILTQNEALKKLQEKQSSIWSGLKELNPFTNGDYKGSLEEPFASLCILSYERPDHFQKSLDSLHEHTNYPFELIIHDDGSREEVTQRLVDDERREGATVIKNPPGHNQGQGAALNRMFSIAKGDPIIKLDADLIYYPGWLLETCRLLTSHPEIGLLGLLHYYHEPVDTRKTVIHREDDYSHHTHILGSGFALRRKCWKELGPFSEHSEAFAEDWEMQMKVTESEKWNCSLPKEDLVKNPAMGYETSTVNKTVAGEMPQIKKGPFIQGADLNSVSLSPVP
jgi:cellulose synthase/poly-beta-1,6-N-acetylglucosamine synthase-like glycosyltransferase